MDNWTAISRRVMLLAAAVALSLGLTACNSSSTSATSSTPSSTPTTSTPTTTTPTYTVGGTIAGLAVGQSVTLLDNGGDGYVATADGSFTFATGVASGASYAVTVGTQPAGQKCSVSNGSGTMGSANLSNVSVSCLPLGFTSLYSFQVGGDGNNPQTGLIMDASGNLYGTTTVGGTFGYGTVFKLDPSGTETVLHSFGSGGDGRTPYSGLVMDASGNLYGTTYEGGANNYGTVFKLDPSGTETVLHSFGSSGSDGKNPYSDLIMDANGNLYGTTRYGGVNSWGTAFKLDPSGAVTVLHAFGLSGDGAVPQAGLLMDASGNLYGTTYQGGAYANSGTLFKIDSSGTETVLHSFGSGSDGVSPQSDLIMDASGNLYGTTVAGGANGNGTVFKFDPSGTETVLYSFGTGSDGANPDGGVVMDASGNLYGTTYNGGGTSGYGVVYKLDPSGTETILHTFSGNNDGGSPNSSLLMNASGNLYGAAQAGGSSGKGTVFRYVLP